MVQGQGYLDRFRALGSRRSLEQPWSSDLPNPYPKALVRGAERISESTQWLRHRWARRGLAAGLVLLLVGIPLLVGVNSSRAAVDTDPRDRDVPAAVLDATRGSAGDAGV